MELLNDFYRFWMRIGFIVVCIVSLLAGLLFEWGAMRFAAPVVSVFFLIYEFALRKFIWKVFHGDLDVSGKWKATTTYDEGEIPRRFDREKQSSLLAPGTSSQHDAKFKQSCTNLSIELSGGKDFPEFHSTSIKLNRSDEKAYLVYSYFVRYTKENGCENKIAKGIEMLTAVEWEKPKGIRGFLIRVGIIKARPTELKGPFAHCVTRTGAAYHGEATFSRSFS